jgi:hypothetical protein
LTVKLLVEPYQSLPFFDKFSINSHISNIGDLNTLATNSNVFVLFILENESIISVLAFISKSLDGFTTIFQSLSNVSGASMRSDILEIEASQSINFSNTELSKMI